MAGIELFQFKSKPTEEVQSVEQATGQLMSTANQLTSMADNEESRSAKQHSAEQLNSLFLSCSTRTQLTTSLVSLSDILQSSQPIPEDAKSRTCKEIDDSILLLVNLPPFMRTQPADSSGQALKLPRSERSNLINHLVDVKDAVQYDQKATDEAKSSLIAENERIVFELVKLSHEEPKVDDTGSAEVTNREETTGEPASEIQLGR